MFDVDGNHPLLIYIDRQTTTKRSFLEEIILSQMKRQSSSCSSCSSSCAKDCKCKCPSCSGTTCREKNLQHIA